MHRVIFFALVIDEVESDTHWQAQCDSQISTPMIGIIVPYIAESLATDKLQYLNLRLVFDLDVINRFPVSRCCLACWPLHFVGAPSLTEFFPRPLIKYGLLLLYHKVRVDISHQVICPNASSVYECAKSKFHRREGNGPREPGWVFLRYLFLQ